MQTPLVQPLTQRNAWSALTTHFKQAGQLHLRDLFAQDAKRGERMTLEAAGLYLDYSKNRVTDETLQLLFQLAIESGLRERIDGMFRGDKINATEKRAVLHVALRAPKDATILVDGQNVAPQVHEVLTEWLNLPSGSAAALGKATQENGFAISSTSGLAAQTWVRSWHTRRFGTIVNAP
jgi:Phosphoglucose isomerase